MTTDHLSTDTVGLLRRELKDARSLAANIDSRLRKALDPPLQRSGGLVARHAACALIASVERRDVAAVARQNFGGDRNLANLIELRTAAPPAQVSVSTWAAELTVATAVADLL